MAKVILTRKAAEQIAAFRSYYHDKEPIAGERAVAALLGAIRRLEDHPAIGRPCSDYPHLRELVIPFGRSGYVALYRTDRLRVVILTIRHQREAGYEIEEGGL